MAGDHPNPFDMGFGIIVSSLHKNFPGPQKALVGTKVADRLWKAILSGMSTYVSNMHVFNTYTAGLALSRMDHLRTYSKMMLTLTMDFDKALTAEGIEVVARSHRSPPTHHIWIRGRDRNDAFAKYQALERCRIYVNFRLLPYDLGFGLRLGLHYATRLGMTHNDVPELASIVADILRNSSSLRQRRRARLFNHHLWERFEASHSGIPPMFEVPSTSFLPSDEREEILSSP